VNKPWHKKRAYNGGLLLSINGLGAIETILSERKISADPRIEFYMLKGPLYEK
jgi:hypothetical protein